MKTQTPKTTPEGPDMSRENDRELQRLRKEEIAVLKNAAAHHRKLTREVVRVMNAMYARLRKMEAAHRKAVKLERKLAMDATAAHRRELARIADGKVKNERLAAIRRRIAVLEGRQAS